MSATTTHLTPAQIKALSSAYTDSNARYAARVSAVYNAVIVNGVTVKTLREDMLIASRADSSVTVVSQAIYGHSAATAQVLATLSLTPSAVDNEVLATLTKTAKWIELKAFKALVSETLAPLSDDISADDKLGMIASACDVALSGESAESRRDGKRAAHSQGGTSNDVTEDDVDADEPIVQSPAGKPTAAEIIAGLRRSAKYLAQGGAVDADMRGAIADFLAELAKADKRSKAKVTA